MPCPTRPSGHDFTAPGLTPRADFLFFSVPGGLQDGPRSRSETYDRDNWLCNLEEVAFSMHAMKMTLLVALVGLQLTTAAFAQTDRSADRRAAANALAAFSDALRGSTNDYKQARM